jgi:hypothetical protein
MSRNENARRMMRFEWFLFVLLSAWFVALPASAHHAFAAEYDAHQETTLTGTLTSFEWVNPHAWLHVDVKDANGKVTNWAVEFGGPNALLRRGFRKSDFPSGIELVVDGYRAKNGTPTLNGRSVKLPDGRNLFGGGSAPDAPQ